MEATSQDSSNCQRESYPVYKSPGAAQPHTAAYLQMRKELKKEFPTQGGTTTNKEGIYSKPEASKAKDHKKERGSKATKANSSQKQDS